MSMQTVRSQAVHLTDPSGQIEHFSLKWYLKKPRLCLVVGVHYVYLTSCNIFMLQLQILCGMAMQSRPN